jgi:hypothetical protein
MDFDYVLLHSPKDARYLLSSTQPKVKKLLSVPTPTSRLSHSSLKLSKDFIMGTREVRRTEYLGNVTSTRSPMMIMIMMIVEYGALVA